MNRKQKATASSLACHLLQLQPHIHQMLQSEYIPSKNPFLQARQSPSWATPWPRKTAFTPIIKTSVANSDELLQQFLTAFTFLTDACRQSWILTLIKTLPLGPWLALDRAMDGTSWQSLDLFGWAVQFRILEVNVFLAQTMYFDAMFWTNGSKFWVFVASKFDKNTTTGSLWLFLLGLGFLACASVSDEVAAAASSTLIWPPWLKASFLKHFLDLFWESTLAASDEADEARMLLFWEGGPNESPPVPSGKLT